MNRLTLALIAGYQHTLAWVLPTRCRFYPSCSQYAAEAYRRHGWWRATRLSVGRLLRCQPLARAGYDPVPEPTDCRPRG